MILTDLDEVEYHAHPALSSTGAKQLLKCPARFKWQREHGQPPKQVFDFGSAAHRLVLGKGADLAVIDADDWRGKAARDARDVARAEGKTPVLTKEHEQAAAMAAAIHEHPLAGPLFRAGTGEPEQSLFWTDEATGVPLRARLDWLRPAPEGGRTIIADYKTSGPPVDLPSVAKTIHAYGYHQQADFYLRGVRALGIDEDPVFLFALQEKEPPYPITVVQLDDESLRVGRERNDRAIALYAKCMAEGRWPAYTDEIALVSLPAWAINQHDAEEAQ